MPNYVIENDDTTSESNVESQEQAEVQTESEGTPLPGETQTEETQVEQTVSDTPTKTESPEPVVEIEGEKVPVSKLKEWKEAYGNDSKWKDKNRREAERINAEKRELEALKLLKPALEQRPDILQQLLTPKRDIDAEVQAHYGRRPDAYADPQAFAQWEYVKDQLLSEQTTTRLQTQAKQEMARENANRANEELYQSGVASYYKEKLVDASEFADMQRWIMENIKDKHGVYPKNSFDVAFAALHPERKMRTEKIETVKSVLKSQQQAVPAKQPGVQKAETTSELTESESAFVAEMRARQKR